MNADEGPVEVYYDLTGFRAALRAPDRAPLQYFDGFHDRCDGGGLLTPLPILEVDPPVPPSAAEWSVDVEGRTVSVARTADGYTVWSGTAGRFYIWSAARRLLRDLWLTEAARRSPLAFVHASAVDDGRHLVLFVGDKRAGKTTMMLDATLRHGWRLVSNDTLMIFKTPLGHAVTGLPTYVGIRRDVVHRFDRPLRERISGDAANEGTLRHWLTTPVPRGREDKLYVSHGVFGKPVSASIPLAERAVTVVAVGFAEGEPADPVDLDADLSDFLRANHKPTGISLLEVFGAGKPFGGDLDCVHALAQDARFLAYRHRGDAGPALREAATVRLSECR